MNKFNKKQKIILGTIIFAIIILMVTVVKATNESPTVKTEIYGANKSIKVTLSDIELDDSHNYSFGLSKVKATQPTEWNDVFSIENTNAEMIITPEKEIMKTILRTVDEAFIFVKDVTENKIVINGVKVSLELDLEDALDINFNDGKYKITYIYRANTIGSYFYKVQKIDDTNIIKRYLEAKNNNQNTMLAVKSLLPKENVASDWNKMTTLSTDSYAYNHDGSSTKYEGLYLIWGQVSFEEGRSIYGYKLYDNFPDGYKLVENQEKPETPTTPTEENKGEQQPTQTPTQTQKPSTTPTTTKQTGNTADGTSAKGALPNTGKGTALLGIIGILTIIVSVIYSKNREYKDIK